MSVVEEFKDILEHGKEQEIIPFLQKLDSKDKKQLAPYAKKMLRKYFEYAYSSSLGSEAQYNIASYAGFVCLNYNDFRQVSVFPNYKIYKKILPWYEPKWLAEYLDSRLIQGTRIDIEYPQMLEYIEKGWITPSDYSIAMLLSRRAPSNAMETLTREKHIWYLFEHECSVWHQTLQKLS